MTKTNSKLIISLILIIFAVALVATKLQSQLTNPTQQLKNTETVATAPIQNTLPPSLIELEVQEMPIDVDSTGFYLDGKKITTLDVRKNSFITLEIHVLPNIGYYGLIFRSPRFPDLKINAGETSVVEFDGVGEFEIISYKPATATSPAESELAVLRVIAS